MKTCHVDSYALGLDFVDASSEVEDDPGATIVDDGGPELERCLALASLHALYSRHAALQSQIDRTSTGNRRASWCNARVQQRDRIEGQIRDALERLEAIG